jgi:hypothetical protein
MYEAGASCKDNIARAPVTNWEPSGVTLAGYCYPMRHGMKLQIVTRYRVSHLQRCGVTERVNVTSVYPPLVLLMLNIGLKMFKQSIPVLLNMLLIKLYKSKSKHNCINNASAVTFLGFVSHLQAEYTIVVWNIYYSAISGFDEISSCIIMKYYKK